MPTPVAIATPDRQSAASTASLPARPFRYNRERQLTLDGIPLAALARRFGTPLYVYSALQIQKRLALFNEAFRTVPHRICYAVKANSSLAILQMLGRLDAGFDIVSGGELERVRRACPEALERVVFSGVGKQAWEMDAALHANILLFNVESAAEIDLLAARAQLAGLKARFALRVNPDVLAETHPYISTGLREHKFGVDMARARELYRQAAAHSSLCATGVSVHIGSQIREVAPFAEALGRVATLVRELRADGHVISHVDAGGGLGIDYTAPLFIAESTSSRDVLENSGELRGESPDQHPDLKPEEQVRRYASALLPVVCDLGCTLVLEPGRFLVAPAGGLLTRVLGEKRTGRKRFVIVDAAMNDLIRPALYQAHHEILPVDRSTVDCNAERSTETHREPAGAEIGEVTPQADVVGPVCESGDFFAHDRALGPQRAGDLLLLADAGAYGMSQSSNYNTRVRPAELLIAAGEVHLIRRRETLDDLLATERLL